MKLCHIKCDHPACVSTDDGRFEHINQSINQSIVLFQEQAHI